MFTLTTKDQLDFNVYLSGPEQAEAGILIVHEWWGVKPHNLVWAERFAELGYIAMVVDLYDGRTTDDPEQAGQWMRDIDQTAADSKLEATLQEISKHCNKVAVYGCSFGGKQAMQLSLLAPDRVDATVLAYCRMETDPIKLAGLQAPVLAIYAEQERGWPQKQHDFEAAMSAAGKHTIGVSYDAAHGFSNPDSPRYDPEADTASWAAIVDFLRTNLFS